MGHGEQKAKKSMMPPSPAITRTAWSSGELPRLHQVRDKGEHCFRQQTRSDSSLKSPPYVQIKMELLPDRRLPTF